MTQIEAAAPTRLSDASLTPRGSVHKSPGDWRDQILYFLLPDRFSNAAGRPLYDRRNPGQFAAADKAAWMNAGRTWQGGTIKGITARLDYLAGLGVTALWIGPVWKQRADLATYHGYGIQDFLDVDPRFGTRQDLRDLVDAAHAAKMYVILDIIYNHTGNNFFYALDGGQVESTGYRYSPPYDVTRWRSAAGAPTAAIGGRDDGVWPVEFQNLDWYTRAGSIGHWDAAPWENPLDPRNEFRRGDFFDLKDLGVQESAPSTRDPRADQVLSALIKVYQYWIALTDCDGFRVDTVKHVSFEASRNFCGAIHEYTESIGKENFLVLGEVAGGAAMARNYLDIFGRNLDAALDLGEPMETLTNLAKGFQPPSDFFAEFGGHDELGTHREIGRYHVSMIDDHDMIHRKPKRRFAGGAQQANAHGAEQAALAVGIQLTTLGIPCISNQVLSALIKVYQYWIALTDCDGFRVDTVKHVSFEASRNFCGAIHEYTESIGKENFLILGEVAGGAGMARNYLDIFGRNLDAALDLGEPMETLTNLAKGFQPPADLLCPVRRP